MSSAALCIALILWLTYLSYAAKEDAFCDHPVAPENGKMNLIGGKPAIGKLVIFSCEDGWKLIGSVVAKCLKTRVWTSPVPKCVESCTVPLIENGVIGRYENSQFKEVKVGESVEEGKDASLKCNKNYEPAGESKSEIKISCTNGKWSVEPRCLPVAGTCSVQKLAAQPGLILGLKIHYLNGELLTPECAANYEVSNKENNNLTCVDGEWIGYLPPCKAELCTVPFIENGVAGLYVKILNRKRFIASDVGHKVEERKELYLKCNTNYEPAEETTGEIKISCTNGGWDVESLCIPVRCKRQQLEFFLGLALGHRKYYLDGEVFTPECNDYYELSEKDNSTLTCVNGHWEGHFPPCKAAPCTVPIVENGVIGLYRALWSRYSSFMEMNVSQRIEQGQYLVLKCNRNYEVAGNRTSEMKISCTNGRWDVEPLCIPASCTVPIVENGVIGLYRALWSRYSSFMEMNVGQRIEERHELFLKCNKNYEAAGNQRSEMKISCTNGRWDVEPLCIPNGTLWKTESTIPSIKQPINDASSSTSIIVSTTTDKPNRGINDDTSTNFCAYTWEDDDLLAVVDNELLTYGSNVKNGSYVKFRCKRFQRLIGPRKLQCLNKIWHWYQFPICVNPFSDDLECPVLSETENLIISYTQDRKVNSKAGFHCSSSTVLHGASYVKCLPNGTWSGPVSSCSHLECPVLSETENLIISYTQDRKVNSKAGFHCSSRTVLHGASYVKCLPNGTWSGPVSSCSRIVGCAPLVKPEASDVIITPQKESYRFGEFIIFSCPSGKDLTSDVERIMCLVAGWTESVVPDCNTTRL